MRALLGDASPPRARRRGRRARSSLRGARSRASFVPPSPSRARRGSRAPSTRRSPTSRRRGSGRPGRRGSRARSRSAAAGRPRASSRARRARCRTPPAGSRRTRAAPASCAASAISSGEASGRAKPMFAPHRVGEQERVLEDDPDGVAEVFDAELAHVDAVEEHAAELRVVEPGEQRGRGRLAGTGPADERDRRPRRDVEREPVEHRPAALVAERDVLEAHLERPRASEPLRIRVLDDGGLRLRAPR